jgi:hypothetical protein
MIKGNVELEDIVIVFANDDGGNIKFTVTDRLSGMTETKMVPQPTFLKALAIAVHNDGTPDYKVDYAEAESIMSKHLELRWIP